MARHIKRLNMTQNAFAQHIGVSSGYMSQLLRGTRHPSPKVRAKVQRKLRVDDWDELWRIA